MNINEAIEQLKYYQNKPYVPTRCTKYEKIDFKEGIN